MKKRVPLAKGRELLERLPSQGSTLGRHRRPSARQAVQADGGPSQGNRWGGPQGRCPREEAAQLALRRLSLPGANQCARKKGSSAHRLPKIRCVPTQAIQPWCKQCLWPLGTRNSSSEAATFNKTAASLNKHKDFYLQMHFKLQHLNYCSILFKPRGLFKRPHVQVISIYILSTFKGSQ